MPTLLSNIYTLLLFQLLCYARGLQVARQVNESLPAPRFLLEQAIEALRGESLSTISGVTYRGKTYVGVDHLSQADI